MYFEEFVLGAKTQIEPAVIEKEDMLPLPKSTTIFIFTQTKSMPRQPFLDQLIAPEVMSFMPV